MSQGAGDTDPDQGIEIQSTTSRIWRNEDGESRVTSIALRPGDWAPQAIDAACSGGQPRKIPTMGTSRRPGKATSPGATIRSHERSHGYLRGLRPPTTLASVRNQ